MDKCMMKKFILFTILSFSPLSASQFEETQKPEGDVPTYEQKLFKPSKNDFSASVDFIFYVWHAPIPSMENPLKSKDTVYETSELRITTKKGLNEKIGTILNIHSFGGDGFIVPSISSQVVDIYRTSFGALQGMLGVSNSFKSANGNLGFTCYTGLSMKYADISLIC